MLGQTLGHYRIEAKLSEGGMGVVYRALDTHLDRPVAIKVLRPEAVADPERKRRFVQEAKAASALNHPNILTIYDIDTAGGVDFMAMEYVPGKTLDSAVGHKGLRLGEALKYAVQIADALAKAHAAGIVHRDIKPSNLMVSEEGLVKVLDFGLAKLTEPVEEDQFAATQTEKPRTEEGAILGTVAYMSPEQAEAKKVDARSDIFSFGSVLYEMLTGRRPFQGETRLSTLSAILREEPKPLRQIVPGAPREVERIIARCLRKDRLRRFQGMADLKVALEELKEESESGAILSEQPAPARPARRWVLGTALAGGIVLVTAAYVAWWLSRSRPPAPTRGPILTRLTTDSGLTTDPALSPDGKLLAYASDRSGEGNLDIWVQQVAGGEAIRLTRHEADDHEPAFSPDGSQIAFRSEREGGGIYVISALGGEGRLIARNGRRPRFSPDDSQIAYWVGAISAGPGGSKIHIVSSTGERPQQVQPNFARANSPVWSPEGKNLLFWGCPDTAESCDWWVAPLGGGAALKTGALAAFRQQGLSATRQGEWSRDGVVFSAALGDSTNLWQVAISPKTWRIIIGSLRRLTFGAGLETQPSVAAGERLAFSSETSHVNIWSLPLEARQGKVAGPIQRLTQEAAFLARPAVSADGNKLVFLSKRSGHNQVWVKDLESGKESALTVSASEKDSLIMTADGSRVAYTAVENQKSPIYVVPAGGGLAEKVCEDCGSLRSWSLDGRRILYLTSERRDVFQLDTASGEKIHLLGHPRYNLYQASFSPDDRWVTFLARISPDRTRLFIISFRAGPAPAENEWIPVTSGEYADDKPRWSPDGKLLYFTSERDGFRCIWAQRLDPATKQPAGPPLVVYHSHSARLSLMSVPLGGQEISVARDKLVFNMNERTGNIWMARWEGH